MSDTPSETAPMKLALTAEEWSVALHDTLAPDGGIDYVRRERCMMWRHDDGDGEVGVRENDPYGVAHVLGTDLHALAALALYGQPFGFTWDDVATLARHIDLSDDLYADPALMSFIRRLKALLPPEPSDHKPTVHRGGLADLPRLFEEELNRKL